MVQEEQFSPFVFIYFEHHSNHITCPSEAHYLECVLLLVDYIGYYVN